jgi:transposase
VAGNSSSVSSAINQVRGLLLERGITLRKGRRHVDAALPGILEDADAKLLGALRVLLAQLKLELDHLEMRIDQAERDFKGAHLCIMGYTERE